MIDRFLAKIEVSPTGCWEWLAFRQPNGYGRFRVGRQMDMAHRAAYLIFIGPIPAALTIDHLCRNRGCVNPTHLEAVPNAVNVLRGEGWSGRNVRKAACPQGHPYDESNTIVSRKGYRRCRTCLAATRPIYRARHLAKKAAA